MTALACPSRGGRVDRRDSGHIVPGDVVGRRVAPLAAPRPSRNGRNVIGRLSLGTHVVVAGGAICRPSGVVEYRAGPSNGRMANAAIKIGNYMVGSFTADRTARIVAADTTA